MNKRRSFIRNTSALLTWSMSGLPVRSSGYVLNPPHSEGIQILDKEIVFTKEPVNSPHRTVPDEFIFSQFPAIPDVPETIPVDFPWRIETTATFPERSLNGLGALNEGIYAEGQNILQIIATTPGKPDTKGGSPSYKNWYRRTLQL